MPAQRLPVHLMQRSCSQVDKGSFAPPRQGKPHRAWGLLVYVLGRHLAQHATRSMAAPAHHLQPCLYYGMGSAYRGHMLARPKLGPRCQLFGAAGHTGMTHTAWSS